MRPAPNRLQRLPQQHVPALVASVSAAAPKLGPPVVGLGRPKEAIAVEGLARFRAVLA